MRSGRRPPRPESLPGRRQLASLRLLAGRAPGSRPWSRPATATMAMPAPTPSMTRRLRLAGSRSGSTSLGAAWAAAFAAAALSRRPGSCSYSTNRVAPGPLLGLRVPVVLGGGPGVRLELLLGLGLEQSFISLCSQRLGHVRNVPARNGAVSLTRWVVWGRTRGRLAHDAGRA